MTAVLQKLGNYRLFQRSGKIETSIQIIKWWEIRRIAFNIVVGFTGLVTCAITLAIGMYSENSSGEAIGIPDPPLFAVFGIILYGVMANICYTGGWLSEIIAKKIWQERANYYGEISFILGLSFSILLTFLPAIIVSIALAVEMLKPHS